MIRENGGFEMFRMIEVEKYPCNDKREADKRETEIMKELKANMNMIKSYTTDEEKKQHSKEYRGKNKEQIYEKRIEQMKEYREYNKLKIREQMKVYGKKYREINEQKIKEKMKEYSKKHYEINKEKINEKRKEKIICECGCEIVKIALKLHQNSKKDIDLLNKNINNK
jgi:hypothetical protein